MHWLITNITSRGILTSLLSLQSFSTESSIYTSLRFRCIGSIFVNAFNFELYALIGSFLNSRALETIRLLKDLKTLLPLCEVIDILTIEIKTFGKDTVHTRVN